MFHRSENVSDGVGKDGEPENDADVGRISGNDGRPAPSHPQYSPLIDFVAGIKTRPGRASQDGRLFFGLLFPDGFSRGRWRDGGR